MSSTYIKMSIPMLVTGYLTTNYLALTLGIVTFILTLIYAMVENIYDIKHNEVEIIIRKQCRKWLNKAINKSKESVSQK